VSCVLHTAEHGIKYHKEADPRIDHPTYGIIAPIAPRVVDYVCRNTVGGLERILEGSKINVVLAMLVFYRISEIDWAAVERECMWHRPYLVYEWKTGAVHPVADIKKMEVVQAGGTVTGRRVRRFRTKSVVHRQAPGFQVRTVEHVENRVRQLMRARNIYTEEQIEARIWANRERTNVHAGPSTVGRTLRSIISRSKASRCACSSSAIC